jgi:hypothetical protein
LNIPVVPDGYRHCYKCQKVKPIEVFKHKKAHCYECQLEMSRDWKARNKDKVADYMKQWKEENADAVREYNRVYGNERKENDPDFKMRCILRYRMSHLVRRDLKCDHTLSLLGCSVEFFLSWLAYNFAGGMSFPNHGTVWHLDHVIPCARFDLTQEDHQRICFHWTNMKPMIARDNISKGDNIIVQELHEQQGRLGDFIGKRGLWWDGCYTYIRIDMLALVNTL